MIDIGKFRIGFTKDDFRIRFTEDNEYDYNKEIQIGHFYICWISKEKTESREALRKGKGCKAYVI